MITWAIEACKKSELTDELCVSTEDKEIMSVAKEHGASIIHRPELLSEDEVPKMEVIRHADTWFYMKYNFHPDVFVSVQANSPEILAADMDKGIRLLEERSLNEVI